MEKIVEKIANEIKRTADLNPEIGIILGSGLSEVVDKMQLRYEIAYDALPDMPTTSVKGHKNRCVVGKISNKSVIIMQGRFHFYDGFTAKQSVMPIYIFKKLGVKTVIVTNSSGAVNKTFAPGDVVVITDHINLTGQNPLIGGPVIDFGEKFIDMQNCYDSDYINQIIEIAKENNIDVKQGVYLQLSGPSYETKAEIKMASAIGADLVGMSTALEVIAAKQCNLKVLGLSAVSNMASGLANCAMSHDDVLKTSKVTAKKIKILISKFIKNL